MKSKTSIAIRNEHGATLIELIFALVAVALVCVGIYFFVFSAGIMNKRLAIEQQLQQEASVVSEVFLRSIRNARFVSVGGAATPPTQKMINQTLITAHYDDGSSTVFQISGNKLHMNGTQMLTPYLGDYSSPSFFTVYVGGTRMDFTLSMQRTSQGEVFSYARLLGGVKCKNTR